MDSVEEDYTSLATSERRLDVQGLFVAARRSESVRQVAMDIHPRECIQLSSPVAICSIYIGVNEGSTKRSQTYTAN